MLLWVVVGKEENLGRQIRQAAARNCGGAVIDSGVFFEGAIPGSVLRNARTNVLRTREQIAD